MCGIVGLFLKDEALKPQLGDLLADMLITMTDRGPDSAGIAVYSDADGAVSKITIQSDRPDEDFSEIEIALIEAAGGAASLSRNDTHAVITAPSDKMPLVEAHLAASHPALRVMSRGDVIEIYKEVGLPEQVVDRFGIRSMHGTHGIGHTRMATESAVTTMGAHPFSTATDECLVHNGSLSNHNSLRRRLVREGMKFETENDTEVGAAYMTHRMQNGANLGEALEDCLSALDGFYTFVVGTKRGFGVLRDPIACKPAVLAETDRYVAFGSEYRALVNLPGILDARVWEPEPATVYFWEH
ncbi:MAG: glutamine amidotransferase family protein [Hyphomicrobiales bacterium]|nr:glutamine amidotransferase family protein [Hyphomicrobiales bacterium]MCP5001952.1 glutamine amidotransferase family protein [Hyphomicrobiales bacterium]